MTYGSTPFDPNINLYGTSHDILTNGLLTIPHTRSHHLHTILHIPTYYYACKHKKMSHPTQEGVTAVWHIAHFWISYGRCTMHGLPMGRSQGLSRRWEN